MWSRHKLPTKQERLLRLEKTTCERQIELSPEQVQLLERFSPEFRERHIHTRHTGDLVAVDTFFVGHLKGVGKVYLQTLVAGGSLGLVLPSPGEREVHTAGIADGHLTDCLRHQSLREQRHLTGGIADEFPHGNPPVGVDVGLTADSLNQQECQSAVGYRLQFGRVLVGPRRREHVNASHTCDPTQGLAANGIVKCSSLQGVDHSTRAA